ncbi:MAG: DUF523 and DUF1722 domain-containing protein [Chitinispirillaceae bacterium]|nr:DUF523 and DUF1722 domain-containing protein [Chitinispirillaceae bacterium]
MSLPPIKLGISSCLLGNNVRYDGQHKLDHYLHDTLGAFVTFVPLCPETECGLGIPREAMRLVGDRDTHRLLTVRTGRDMTDRMVAWTKTALDRCETEDLCGFVFKSRSPSSAMRDAKIYRESGTVAGKGPGIFARAFMARFPRLPVEDEGRLHDAGIRENFIERVFSFARWKQFANRDGSLRGLIDFHTRHKPLLMAHGIKLYRELGRVVAAAKGRDKKSLFDDYLRLLLDGMAVSSTVKKHTNVLDHCAGYFKRRLSASEKQELHEMIRRYHDGLIPLIAPIVLLLHYTRHFEEPYLARQFYLDPHPAELLLRNHV